MKISTQNLTELPEVDKLKKLCKSLALFSLIFRPKEEDDWLRYHSYYIDWDKEKNEEVVNQNNGCGDEMDILFSKHGAIIAGLAHESVMSGVIDDVPEVFKEFIEKEPIKSMGITFCIWRTNQDNEWRVGKIDFPDNDYKDGSADMLKLLDNNPETYQKFAKDYYEKDLPLELVEKIYAHQPLSDDMVKQINPVTDLKTIKDGVELIAYPI